MQEDLNAPVPKLARKAFDSVHGKVMPEAV